MYTVDLHNHTVFSYDGSNTPELTAVWTLSELPTTNSR